MTDYLEILSCCFQEKSADRKVELMQQLKTDDLDLLKALQNPQKHGVELPAISAAGTPDLPVLVAAKDLPKRSLATQAGRGAFFHAICHIEFTAINLALDAALRFSGMPMGYYSDWLNIAGEEARHFSMLLSHLNGLGYGYGDFVAHDGMWQLAERTAHNVTLRMALIPRVLEARGLDVTPPMIKRLELMKDTPGAAILKQIYKDEIRHVEAGTRWFNFAATAAGLEPEQAFQKAVRDEFGSLRANKLNREARLLAGFTESELIQLGGG